MLRAERRLTQERVAARIGVSQATYSKFERGYEPDEKTRLRLARVFGVDPAALLPESVAS